MSSAEIVRRLEIRFAYGKQISAEDLISCLSAIIKEIQEIREVIKPSGNPDTE